jgi:(S)-ureidoglycine aminohydrolase
MAVDRKYYFPTGGLPGQKDMMTQRAVFTEAYAVIPKRTMCDIVTSFLPHWHKTRAWVLARPLSGFAETFSQYIMEVSPSGGSSKPDSETGAQSVLFVIDGHALLQLNGQEYALSAGSYAYIPSGAEWALYSSGADCLRFHWIRKLYVAVEGIDAPDAFVTHEDNHAINSMPDTNGAWATTRFVEPNDLRHDMHVNIVTFQPGGVIPFEETHVMEHGLYVLEGKAVYKLNQDWVEVEAGDFMWLRAFCPQACYAGGPGPFRYLLYKDVNRHMPLSL